MLARRVTSLAVGDPASQLISQRLMGHFLHVCICPPCLRLTMPRGYERSRAVHQTNHTTEFSVWRFWRINAEGERWGKGAANEQVALTSTGWTGGFREKGKRGGGEAIKGIMSEKANIVGTERSRIPLAGSRHAAVLRCLVQERLQTQQK